jgi:hypothetical protein
MAHVRVARLADPPLARPPGEAPAGSDGSAVGQGPEFAAFVEQCCSSAVGLIKVSELSEQ